VVDDDKALARAIGRSLEQAGHTVHLAHDGNQALRMLAAEPPDVVISDIMMPERDGIELIGDIARQSPAMPIIAISSGGAFGLDVLDLAHKMGAQAVMRKPFRFEDLVDLVGSMIGRARSSATAA